MLAPLVLPFQITAVIFAVFWCAAALRLRARRRIALLSLTSMQLFIPSCVGVMVIVDTQRYGWFDYIEASEVPDDGYIEIPATSKDITLYRNGAGHWAKFTIDTPSLRSWIDERRSLRPDLNNSNDWNESTAEIAGLWHETLEIEKRFFASRFPNTGWTYDSSMIQVQVRRSDRGGGYTVWHVPSTCDTYISASYW